MYKHFFLMNIVAMILFSRVLVAMEGQVSTSNNELGQICCFMDTLQISNEQKHLITLMFNKPRKALSFLHKHQSIDVDNKYVISLVVFANHHLPYTALFRTLVKRGMSSNILIFSGGSELGTPTDFEYGYPILAWSCDVVSTDRHQGLKLIKFLLERDADPDKKFRWSGALDWIGTPREYAAGDPDIIKLFDQYKKSAIKLPDECKKDKPLPCWIY